MVPRPMRIAARHPETQDTFTLELETIDGPPIGFQPGQFNMVGPFGIGEAAISISGAASHPERLVHTIRAVGSVTNGLARLTAGDQLGVRGPFGRGWPMEAIGGRDVVFVAGGIGLAPLRPAIQHTLSDRQRVRSVWIVYGARSPDDLLYRDELHDWRGRFDADVEITVDRADDQWHGDVGVVTGFLEAIAASAIDPVVMVCGPEIMMKVVAQRMVQAGVSTRDIYLSLERNMKCGVGSCGHCQYGQDFICRDGPVLPYSSLVSRFSVAAL